MTTSFEKRLQKISQLSLQSMDMETFSRFMNKDFPFLIAAVKRMHKLIVKIDTNLWSDPKVDEEFDPDPECPFCPACNANEFMFDGSREHFGKHDDWCVLQDAHDALMDLDNLAEKEE